MRQHKSALAVLAGMALLMLAVAARSEGPLDAAYLPLQPAFEISGEAVQDAASPTMIELRESLPRVRTLDLTEPPDDLWERIRSGFAMPNLDSALVSDHQAWYLNRPQGLQGILQRSRRYLFHIVEEIEKRGLPTELALLPMVESAYNPMALSPAKASGLWQFIPSTGRNYRLEQNWWIDQRRDIVAATSAALDYLQTIYEMHGDWHLALASYNWGEGAVGRAIERNRAKGLPTDYASLSMPAETRHYIPKLQALKNIIAQPQLFGLHLEPIPNRPYFVTVERPADMDMALAARLAETPLEEFRALNAAYNRPVASGHERLILPADKADVFQANLERHNKPLLSWQTHTLGRGENLASVAKRYGLSVERLRAVNGIDRRARIGAGHRLLVPARDALAAVEPLAVNLPRESAQPAKARSARQDRSAGKKGKPLAKRAATRLAKAGARATAGKPAAKAAAAKSRDTGKVAARRGRNPT